ncbi:MAG: NADH-quinone oxidoreductase subunit G [Gammaproteobacteria bacterium]|nr:NADH-quinone oxidoreductase subunit G [Gammaproteobacteria bacterium]MYJ51971.1 NADH-quinone oxidoreductase subunit G [Gammaproteobacteria bacterium]
MSTVTIEIDGKPYPAQPGEMLIQVTDRNGIYIPRFCYHEKLSVAANCRMCLIEVEKAPKPLPACATPVTDGMKVFTRSSTAVEAQKGTMEFLLINHPLDCPVCDQGGECPLQDQALGYGKDNSRFMELKRSVPSHDIGPLIATEMTRCIHCTRCVRFGEEVAGVMEMGAPGRGEHVKISTFLNRSIDSEVSGNMIDLCPVGALTSKPFRFAARSWELTDCESISPHDCLGSNILIQTLRNRVERVVPRENPDINECWLADRDRFSYQAINSDRRLTRPMVRQGGAWQAVDWETALMHCAAGLKSIIDQGDAARIGGLASPASTLEEFHLLQKLIRALGSESVDHRLQQCDFRDDDIAPRFPASEVAIREFGTRTSVLLLGSNIRKEQPLLSLRIREGWREGRTRIGSISPVGHDLNFETAFCEVAPGAALIGRTAALAVAVANATGAALPEDMARLSDGSDLSGLAAQMAGAAGDGLIVLGALAQQHRDASLLKAMSQWIAEATGNPMAVLAPGNSAAGSLAGCLPGRGGRNVGEMYEQGMRGLVLLGCQPELDSLDGHAARRAMREADFVVQLGAFMPETDDDGVDVLLPMAAFGESAGTFVNCEGRIQGAKTAVSPLSEAKPAWKILRVLGNFLECPGFDQVTLDDVTGEALRAVGPDGITPSCRLREFRLEEPVLSAADGLTRISFMPMYRGDAMVRNALALQRTADNPGPLARLHPDTLRTHSLGDGDRARIGNGSGAGRLEVVADERVPPNCVAIPAGFAETADAGGRDGVALIPIGEESG